MLCYLTPSAKVLLSAFVSKVGERSIRYEFLWGCGIMIGCLTSSAPFRYRRV